MNKGETMNDYTEVVKVEDLKARLLQLKKEFWEFPSEDLAHIWKVDIDKKMDELLSEFEEKK